MSNHDRTGPTPERPDALTQNNANVFDAVRELVASFPGGLLYGLFGAYFEQLARRDTRQRIAAHGQGGNRFFEAGASLLEVLLWPLLSAGFFILAVYHILRGD